MRMGFIHLTAKTLNEDAIALIDWHYHPYQHEPKCVRVLFTTGESLSLDIEGLDAEILRSHFRLVDVGGVMTSAEGLEGLEPEPPEPEESSRNHALALTPAQSSLDNEIPF